MTPQQIEQWDKAKEALDQFAKVMVDQVLPVVQDIADSIMATFNNLFGNGGFFDPVRLAIEEHGVTEADIHHVDITTGTVYLWSRRWVDTRTGETGFSWRRQR